MINQQTIKEKLIRNNDDGDKENAMKKREFLPSTSTSCNNLLINNSIIMEKKHHDDGNVVVIGKNGEDRIPLAELNVNTLKRLNSSTIESTSASQFMPVEKKKKCQHHVKDEIMNSSTTTITLNGRTGLNQCDSSSCSSSTEFTKLSEFNFLLEREKKQSNVYYFDSNVNTQNTILTNMYESIVHILCEFHQNCKYLHLRYCTEQNSDICRYCYMNEHVFSMSYLFARRLCFSCKSSSRIAQTVTKVQNSNQTKQFFKLMASALYRIALKVADLCFPLPNQYSFSKYISKESYVSTALPNMELQILNLFNYDHLLATTPVSFLSVLMNAAMCCDDALTNMLFRMKIEERVIELFTKSEFLIQGEAFNFTASKLCCGALALVRKELDLPPWSDNLQQFTSYQLSDFEDVMSFFSKYSTPTNI